jgi:hypothetical protein
MRVTKPVRSAHLVVAALYRTSPRWLDWGRIKPDAQAQKQREAQSECKVEITLTARSKQRDRINLPIGRAALSLGLVPRGFYQASNSLGA